MQIIAISGVKNSGKTTLICGLLEVFKRMGLKVATIKHDGHDFEGDVPGTDTYRHLQYGAYGTAIFSSQKYMVVKQKEDISVSELMDQFPEADMILLEGFKYSSYPKIELIRKGNSISSVCTEPLLAIATDVPKEKWTDQFGDHQVLDLNCPSQIAEFILTYGKQKSYVNSAD